MAHYRSVGAVPPKRHTQHRDPEGKLYYEELMGEEGFSSDSSLLYHRNIPSAITEACEWQLPDQSRTPNRPLLPRHLVLPSLFDAEAAAGIDAVTGRRLVLANADVRISYVLAGQASPFYRNAVGDECVFVQAGAARVETVFGALEVGPGDYLIIPRATTHRWLPTGDQPLRLYCIEANSHITPAKRYLSRFGQLLEHAPYCERDLRGPTEPLAGEGADVAVYVKHRDPGAAGGIAGTVHVSPHHPLDVVGWDGCLYPYAFNVADFEPITGRVHQPPPVHQVFEGENFVICNFVPRKVDYHPLSIPVPYYHSNVDSDEVMFYVAGNYEARKGSGIGPGSISLHPGGHSHGPQPGSYEASIGAQSFDELAVMVDTFRPLELGEGGQAADDGRYAWELVGRSPVSIPALFAGLFDDAALFPPGNAPMDEAVSGHAGYRQDWYADLVARFVCPAGRLGELDAALAGLDEELAGLDFPQISMTVPGGPADLAAALATAEGYPRLRIAAVELPLGAARLPAALDELGGVAERGIAVYAEVPVAEVSAELAAALRSAGLALKLRTGGSAAEAFPAAVSLAAAIEAAVAGGVRFKCTAGLHNAVGHDDPVTGWAHHGFLNVLLAVHSAQSGGVPPAELLADRDGAALAEQASILSAAEVAAVREKFASIGSCSIEEPLTDLTELKLVSAA